MFEGDGGDPFVAEDDGPTNPARILWSGGAGFTVRLIQDFDFGQDRFAPAFIDLLGGYVFEGSGTLRHGVTIGVSTNLTGDGTQQLGVDELGQWVLSPGYLLYVDLNDSVDGLVLMGKVGVPLSVSEEFSIGGELSAGLAYLFLAGFGVYGEVGASLFFGGGAVHPMLSGELGVQFEYEVLP